MTEVWVDLISNVVNIKTVWLGSGKDVQLHTGCEQRSEGAVCEL